LTGRPGELTTDFAAIGAVDSFEPSDALWYKAMRRLQLQRGYDSNHLACLRESILSDNVELIYVNSIASAGLLDFLSFADCPVICHVHELDWAIRVIGIGHLALLERRRPLYIAVSNAVRNSLVENYGISPNRIKVIHGFVPVPQDDDADPQRDRKAVRTKLGIAEDAKLVCACGAIGFRKGTDLFLQVVALVAQEYRATPVHFVWVGGAPDDVAAMRSQVANSALKGVVHFVGHTSDTDAYYRASDVFVLTSREDPFPLVVMEAAQRGKPIVCFESGGGAPEFVEGDAGFVTPDFDIAGMADKILELLSSPQLCNQMGRAAKQKVIDYYDLDVGSARIAAVIEATMRMRDNNARLSR
jgi:glycosyltransferase involved in cell wall biosynthesis